MAAGGNKKVVLLALGANAGIGVAKLVAYIITGSGSMLAESIHSFADSGNQGLLLLGGSRAARAPDDRHPLGYGREAYFWAMLVAVILFTLGGLFSIYEGVHKLQKPEPLENLTAAIVVLVIGLILEGASLRAAWIECNKARRGRGLIQWGRETGNVDLLVVTFEDIAAMLGLAVALVAVLLSAWTGNPIFDALGSCAVGAMLLVVAVFLTVQVRRLIVGFAAERSIQDEIRRIYEANDFTVLRLIAVWAGPGKVLVASKVKPNDAAGNAQDLMARMNKAEAEARAAVPEMHFQFTEPDLSD